MAKKKQAPDNQDAQVDPEIIVAALAEGRSIVSQGGSKIDAAMAIYRKIETLPQEMVVNAFIEGAALTPKGALTYWYTCRRRLVRERWSANSQAHFAGGTND